MDIREDTSLEDLIISEYFSKTIQDYFLSLPNCKSANEEIEVFQKIYKEGERGKYFIDTLVENANISPVYCGYAAYGAYRECLKEELSNHKGFILNSGPAFQYLLKSGNIGCWFAIIDLYNLSRNNLDHLKVDDDEYIKVIHFSRRDVNLTAMCEKVPEDILKKVDLSEDIEKVCNYDKIKRVRSKKNKWIALILVMTTGIFDTHRFYVGKKQSGILYLCTLGLLGTGVIVDFATLIANNFTDAQGEYLTSYNFMTVSYYG